MSEENGGRQDDRADAAIRREPFFSVFTAPRFLRRNLTPECEREFFATGERFVDDTFRTIDARFVPDFTPVSVLEYGCGVGRLALPLARRAGSVWAVDKSSAMLDVARALALELGVPNIQFSTPDALLESGRKFDLVTCYLVFQRMPPRDGLPLFRTLLNRLGAGGIGVFQFAYSSNAPRYVELARRLRARFPLANRVANLLLGKAADEPFHPRHCYPLDDVLAVLREAGIVSQYLMFEEPGGLQNAVLFVEAPLAFTSGGASEPTATNGRASEERSGSVDVNALIETTSIEALNEAAERYFSSLPDWEFHLAKPFSNVEETPQLLINAGTLLQALGLRPGMTVLEFGAGTGWLSRFLTQLGCRVVLLDVSPTALRIAQELYSRVPVVGHRPEPRFLPFDGRRIDLPDGSVDRVITFDAFHHAPNPDEVLREFARVLAPGGLAGFAEPGPRHSASPMSQFEMRTYGVVEKDVDIHEIWKTAQAAGFSDLRMVVFHEPPFHVSLEEFEDLLAGGETCGRWLTSTRGFLRHVRTFVLLKGSAGTVDSRSLAELACEIQARQAPGAIREGEAFTLHLTVKNVGKAMWLPSSEPVGGVKLGVHLYDQSRALLQFDYATAPLASGTERMTPGQSVECAIAIPSLQRGEYVLEFDCVAARVGWFSQSGSAPHSIRVSVIGNA